MLDALQRAFEALQIEAATREAEWHQIRAEHTAVVQRMEAARIQMKESDSALETLRDYLQFLKLEGRS